MNLLSSLTSVGFDFTASMQDHRWFTELKEAKQERAVLVIREGKL